MKKLLLFLIIFFSNYLYSCCYNITINNCTYNKEAPFNMSDILNISLNMYSTDLSPGEPKMVLSDSDARADLIIQFSEGVNTEDLSPELVISCVNGGRVQLGRGVFNRVNSSNATELFFSGTFYVTSNSTYCKVTDFIVYGDTGKDNEGYPCRFPLTGNLAGKLNESRVVKREEYLSRTQLDLQKKSINDAITQFGKSISVQWENIKIQYMMLSLTMLGLFLTIFGLIATFYQMFSLKRPYIECYLRVKKKGVDTWLEIERGDNITLEVENLGEYPSKNVIINISIKSENTPIDHFVRRLKKVQPKKFYTNFFDLNSRIDKLIKDKKVVLGKKYTIVVRWEYSSEYNTKFTRILDTIFNHLFGRIAFFHDQEVYLFKAKPKENFLASDVKGESVITSTENEYIKGVKEEIDMLSINFDEL